MKIFVAMVVLASCTVEIVLCYSNLDVLRDGIARQKTAVQNTVNRLRRHHLDYSYNLSNKLNAAKTASVQEINSIVNPTLKTIEPKEVLPLVEMGSTSLDSKTKLLKNASVSTSRARSLYQQEASTKSTAEGKDAAQCFETARAGLRKYSQTGFSDLENCVNDALSSVSQDEINMHSTILAGQQVLTFYDSILPSCFTTSTQQMESCIIGLLPEGAELAQAFQTTTDNVISSSNLTAITAQANAVNCNRGPISTVRQGASSVQHEANRCIASL